MRLRGPIGLIGVCRRIVLGHQEAPFRAAGPNGSEPGASFWFVMTSLRTYRSSDKKKLSAKAGVSGENSR
jgi:hypothetical protein